MLVFYSEEDSCLLAVNSPLVVPTGVTPVEIAMADIPQNLEQYTLVDGVLTLDTALVATAEATEQADSARAYLRSTDWYVTRSLETNKLMPEDVRLKREAMRASIKTGY